MARLPLHMLGSPILREPAAVVTQFDEALRTLVADMFDTMHLALGLGLAANQVGRAIRVAVIATEDHRFAMINPTVSHPRGTSREPEGCLSMPGVVVEVTRPTRITLSAFDEHGAPFTLKLSGLAARAVQHEIDHLNGVLIIDHL